VSLWKIACFFLTMLFVTAIQYGDNVSDRFDVVGNLFYLFDRSFSQRNITVNGVRTMFTDIRKKNLCLNVQQ
jgi:hypothetical protein